MDRERKFENYMILADEFYFNEDLPRMKSTLLKALSYAPGEEEKVAVLFDLADLYIDEENWDLSREKFYEILRIDPENPGAYYGLAMLNDFTDGDPSYSKECYERAVHFDPTYDRAYYYLAHTCWDMGLLREAREYLEKTLALVPEDPLALTDLGSFYERQGEYEKARELFLKSIEGNPHYARAYFNMGVVEKRLGRYPEALMYYRRSIEEKSHPHTYLNMSAIYMEQQRYEEALSILREGLLLHPDSVNLHYNSACALVHLGRREEAAEEILMAVDVEPEAKEWAETDDDLEDLMKELEEGSYGDHKNRAGN